MHMESWKNPKTRISNLIRCGIPKGKAYEWGYTRLGYWRIADSWVTHNSMTNERLRVAGYPTLYDEYLKWYPNLTTLVPLQSILLYLRQKLETPQEKPFLYKSN